MEFNENKPVEDEGRGSGGCSLAIGICGDDFVACMGVAGRAAGACCVACVGCEVSCCMSCTGVETLCKGAAACSGSGRPELLAVAVSFAAARTFIVYCTAFMV